MKYFLVIVFVTLLFGCSDPLDRTYHSDSFENDRDVAAALDTTEKRLMISAIFQSQFGMIDIEGKSYRTIIDEAKQREFEQAKKEAEEKHKAALAEKSKNEKMKKMNELLKVQVIDKSFIEQAFDEHHMLRLKMNNLTDREISAFKIEIQSTNIFGDKLTKFLYKDDDPLTDEREKRVYWSYNMFENTEKEFASTDFDKLKFSVEPIDIIFADGERLSLE